MPAICLHCELPLPLLQKLADAKFCSSDHRKAWQEDLQRRMIERLAESEEWLRIVAQRRRAESARHLMPSRASFVSVMPEPVLPELPVTRGVRSPWTPPAVVYPAIPTLPRLNAELRSVPADTGAVHEQTAQIAC